MTDNLFPFLPDGLVDGGLAADAAPPELRAAVDLLRAASQSGSVEELATMATLVQQFSAEVNAAASTNTPASNDSLRSNSMTSTRITRRALSIVAITLLAAGTAAAAAGGALPVFQGGADEVVVEDDASETTVLDDGTDESDTTEGDDEVTDSSVGRENHNGTVDHHGKCTAWTHGAPKSATNPSFAELQVSADAAGLSIDDYCATVLEATGSGDDATSDDDEADDESNDSADDATDDATDDDSAHGDESGHSGHGNGNGGHGDGESDD